MRTVEGKTKRCRACAAAVSGMGVGTLIRKRKTGRRTRWRARRAWRISGGAALRAAGGLRRSARRRHQRRARDAFERPGTETVVGARTGLFIAYLLWCVVVEGCECSRMRANCEARRSREGGVVFGARQRQLSHVA